MLLSTIYHHCQVGNPSFPSGPKNTNIVEDIRILFPDKFCWILFSGFRSRKCLSDWVGHLGFPITPKSTIHVIHIIILYFVMYYAFNGDSLLIRKVYRSQIFNPTLKWRALCIILSSFSTFSFGCKLFKQHVFMIIHRSDFNVYFCSSSNMGKCI